MNNNSQNIKNKIISYKKYVQIIMNVIHEDCPSFEVNIVYNDDEALLSGGSYASFAGCEEEIIKNNYNLLGMFDVYDFLEEKHMKYYHVGLNPDISKYKNNKGSIAIKSIIEELNLPFLDEVFEIFVILHEIGHSYQFLIDNNKNIEWYIKTVWERNKFEYCLKNNEDLDSKQKQFEYRKFPQEAYADNFACKYIKKVLNTLSICTL